MNGIDFALAGNVNGESGFGEFPWTVALLSGYADCLCGASLIHPSVVLTGAHCVFNLTAGNLKIRAGEWDTQVLKTPFIWGDYNVVEDYQTFQNIERSKLHQHLFNLERQVCLQFQEPIKNRLTRETALKACRIPAMCNG